MNSSLGHSTPRTVCLLLVCIGFGCHCASAAVRDKFARISNASFQQGDDGPAGWKLSGGKGRWVDREILEVSGTGADSSYWRCNYRFLPGGIYHLQVRGRGTPTDGCAIVGPAFASRDYQTPSKDWIRVGHVFRVPDNVDDSYLRLGQWHAIGTIQFDSVRLLPAMPAHKAVGKLLLGEGESIRDGRYTFCGTFNHEGSNYHRPLLSTTTAFNSDRWTFGGKSQVTYRFDLPGHKLLSGQVSFNVNYHVRGACLVEVSRDRKTWHAVATQEKVGTARATLPDELLPAETIFLRLRAATADGSFQVDRVEFTAELSGTPTDAVGETMFVDIEDTPSQLVFERFALRDHWQPHCLNWKILEVTLRNASKYHHVYTDLTSRQKRPHRDTRGPMQRLASLPNMFSFTPPILAPGESTTWTQTLLEMVPGKNKVSISLREDWIDLRALRNLDPAETPERGTKTTKISLEYDVPEFYRSDYGQWLESDWKQGSLWWCPAAHKIPRKRALPRLGPSKGARFSAARNDHEAVQIVVRPRKDLKGLTAAAGALVGPGGAQIPAENVKTLRVAYHFVHHPTDKTGVRDFWPDALPPLTKPIDVPAGENQPLWVLVYVPEDAKPGDYSGKISLKAEGFSADVPIKLHVWDFALPKRNHIETAFGFSAGNVFRYHGLKSDADKRRVLEMYFQCFADHRISPYDPAPLDRIGVKFRPDADPPDAQIDFSAFDRAMTRAVEKYNFTGVRLPVQGMGGGTFHSRSEPRIGQFGENTPQYQAMFSSYVKQLEEHLRRNDWLKMAYIYWFDEPAPKDYKFVAGGMNRLKKYAPGLRRMLTEEPGDNPLSGTVDIWCPISNNYNHQMAQKRRANGERFWWYVCTGPKAPYCTLFIDHPATELRAWLWQTWQRKITGVLVWQSNYWTSSAAFPDQPQDPYEDPMGYVSGYSTPRGTKRYWGNGDGRFIYPPEAAAVPGKSGPDPVIRPPVSSIRWEMLREGIEDYEMLYLLRELLAKRRDNLPPEQVKQCGALLEVPAAITRDMTTFTTDPEPIYARRAKIAEAIERLME